MNRRQPLNAFLAEPVALIAGRQGTDEQVIQGQLIVGREAKCNTVQAVYSCQRIPYLPAQLTILEDATASHVK